MIGNVAKFIRDMEAEGEFMCDRKAAVEFIRDREAAGESVRLLPRITFDVDAIQTFDGEKRTLWADISVIFRRPIEFSTSYLMIVEKTVFVG